MQVETEKIIANIIKTQMNLDDNQVWIYNSDFVIPNNDGLFMVVEFQDSKIIANNNRADTNSTGGFVEIQETLNRENILIDVFSKNSDARKRKNEIIFALNSLYSEQQQEKYNFKIFRIPSGFSNTSEAEGSAMLTRFSIVVACQVWYRNEITHTDNYYDNFGTDVYDEPALEADIPLFEINPTQSPIST